MSTRIAALLFVCLVLATACSQDGGATSTTTGRDSDETTTSTSTVPSTTEPSTTTTIEQTTTTEPATTSTLGVQNFSFVALADEIDGPERIEVTRGSMVVITVTGAVTDEVHLHGYDLIVDLTPQSAAIIEFRADIAGIFEVELENSGRLLTEIVVR